MATTIPAYRITGGQPIRGEITCLGAKNFVTKAMVATMLADTPTSISNVPPIGDTTITRDMLSAIGATITELDRHQLTIDPRTITTFDIPLPDSGSNRIPVLLLGALLHRCQRVSVPVLGGCTIGERKVDFHIDAIEKFGGHVEVTAEGYVATCTGRLQGAQITLPYPSVGATETCLYLGVLAEGRTVIHNAAIEPEIFELITMLRSMGAIIFTTPGREIRIEGVTKLHGTRIHVLGDRIETASWACLAAASDGDIIVHGIRPEILGNFLSYYQQVGGGFELVGSNSIRFFRQRPLTSAIIETDVYPGFSTDWQQPFAVLLTQSQGISVIHETVYENRFGYLKALSQLGAVTQLTTHCLGGAPCRYRDANHMHSAIIVGGNQLHAVDQIAIPDLRAGLAYVIAAAVAQGSTTLTGTHYLERGYGDIVPRLGNLGLDIVRV